MITLLVVILIIWFAIKMLDSTTNALNEINRRLKK